MIYIFLIILLFAASVMAHVIFCRRTSKAGLQAKAFCFIAGLALCIYISCAFYLAHARIVDPSSLGGMPFRITAGIIFVLLIPIYLCFYVLTQLMSPSKKILLTIDERGQASQQDILSSVQKEDFIMTRLHDLRASGCVVEKDGRLILTASGQQIAAVLNTMQLILGRNVGG